MQAVEQDIEAVRRMSPAEKLAVMKGLIRTAYELKAAAIRARWPDLPEPEVQARVRAPWWPVVERPARQCRPASRSSCAQCRPMTDPDLIGIFIEPLERLGVPYVVDGGVASVIYGDRRFARDIDIVLRLRAGEIAGLVAAPPARTSMYGRSRCCRMR